MADPKAAPAAAQNGPGKYTGPLVVDPITRIEGHLRMTVEVADGKIKDAWSQGTLFRGLEIILKGRDPRDAQHFTQRTCGVCTHVHALASTRALEDAIGVTIPANATLIRNLVMGAQFLHDHIVHFYHLHALDWVDVTAALKADPAKTAQLASSISTRAAKAEDFKAVQTKLKALVDSGQLGIFTNAYFLNGHPAYVLPPEANLMATAHYLEALRMQVKAARLMAMFGGKNPHTQFMVAGGVTCYNALAPEKLAEFAALWKEVRAFVDQVYIPDLLAVAANYKNWGSIGGTTNFLGFGEYPDAGKGERGMDNRYFPAGFILNRNIAKVDAVDPKEIKEHVSHSWYKKGEPKNPFDGVTEPEFTKIDDRDRYSWSKAPRYKGESIETGPLARLLVAYGKGHAETKKGVDAVLQKLGIPVEALFSTLGRTAARGIETSIVAGRMEGWLNDLVENIKKGDTKIVEKCDVPQSGQGVGFADVPRGGLSHWINIENKKIANFQLVVPSTWNLGPRCDAGKKSAVEEALIGTPIADPKRPVELLRTVHSFDPCIACGVHVIQPDSNEVLEFKIV